MLRRWASSPGVKNLCEPIEPMKPLAWDERIGSSSKIVIGSEGRIDVGIDPGTLVVETGFVGVAGTVTTARGTTVNVSESIIRELKELLCL